MGVRHLDQVTFFPGCSGQLAEFLYRGGGSGSLS